MEYSRFIDQLNRTFIPALPSVMGPLGAVAYLPALSPLPEQRPSGIPDEFALVAYESEAAYQQAMQTDEGRRYGLMHWDVFDRARTKSGGAEPLDDKIEADTPYDILGKPVDWQGGYALVYVGLRGDDVGSDVFLEKLYRHVADFRDACGRRGLNGYVVVATEQFEAAYTHWPDKQTATSAFIEPGDCKSVADRAIELFKRNPPILAGAEPFQGALAPQRAANVLFPTRSSR